MGRQIINDVNKQCEILSFNDQFQVKWLPGLDAQACAKRHNVIADHALVELFASVCGTQLLYFLGMRDTMVLIVAVDFAMCSGVSISMWKLSRLLGLSNQLDLQD